MPSHVSSRRNFLTDLAAAVFCSASAVTILAGALAALRWHELDGPRPDDAVCSITNCIYSRDGDHLLLTYWKPDRGTEKLRYRLATLDLRQDTAACTIAPGAFEPRNLAPIAGNTAYVVDLSGSVGMRRIDNAYPLFVGDVRLPDGCPSSLFSSADGQLLLAFRAGLVQMFDVKQNRLRWQREGIGWECVVFHPQAGLFASLSGRVVQLAVETGVIVRTLAQHDKCIRSLAVDPCGGLIAWLDDSGGIETRRLSDSRQLWVQKAHGAHTLPESHRPTMFANVLQFSADGRYLVTSANEGEWVLAVWRAKSGNRVKTLRGHDHVVNGARFLPDGTLASWGRDGTLRVWDVKRGFTRRVFNVGRLT